MNETIIHDGPDDTCFGCGHQNAQGLRLVFRVTGPDAVEADYTAPEHFCGAPNVVHGGIQATLLDEVMGIAVHVGSGGDRAEHVTAEMSLRYRRPAHAGRPLRVRARFLRSEGRDFFAEGQILDAEGEILTRAESRWRAIG
ncbi:MAG: PaaI family thioesterase [Myxococcota bacterium]